MKQLDSSYSDRLKKSTDEASNGAAIVFLIIMFSAVGVASCTQLGFATIQSALDNIDKLDALEQEWIDIQSELPPVVEPKPEIVAGVDAVNNTIGAGSSGDPIKIGSLNAGYQFLGQLDDVLIFDRALTAEEIELLYNESINKDGAEW